jgi:DNA-binding XRE family transcriptional regulator
MIGAATVERLNTREYERIATARYEPPFLIVGFEDGSDARLHVDLLGRYGVRADEWDRARAEEYHVSIPTRSGTSEIPWDVIRYLTDPEFHDYWDEVMRHAAQKVGARLRALREERGLGQMELAERAGIPLDLLRDVEANGAGADLELEVRILTAMGCTLDDLVEPE